MIPLLVIIGSAAMIISAFNFGVGTKRRYFADASNKLSMMIDDVVNVRQPMESLSHPPSFADFASLAAKCFIAAAMGKLLFES